MRGREIQKAIARARGYFWLPCPLCGREFGGHEWEDIDGLSSAIYTDPTQPNIGTGICPVCTAQGKGNWPSSGPESSEQ